MQQLFVCCLYALKQNAIKLKVTGNDKCCDGWLRLGTHSVPQYCLREIE
jgi:hypothetical protein